MTTHRGVVLNIMQNRRFIYYKLNHWRQVWLDASRYRGNHFFMPKVY